jgi:Rnl2 family RNA ligase
LIDPYEVTDLRNEMKKEDQSELIKSMMTDRQIVAHVVGHQFRAYPSIANGDDRKVTDAIAATTNYFHPDEPWIATEKVHGSNIAFVVHRAVPGVVRIQRRGGFLIEGEKFHGIATNADMHKIQAGIVRMFDDPAFSEVTQLTVFGELYGQGIQKFHYSHSIHFVCYDLLRDDRFESYVVVASSCERYGIPFVRPIREGSYASLREPFDLEKLESQYPALHHSVLASRPPTIAEGIVLRPKQLAIPYPIRNKEWPVLKLKRAAFQERSAKGLAAQAVASESEAVTLACSFITQARLENVQSKLLTDARPDEISRAVVADAMEEIEETEWYLTLSSDNARKKLKHAVTKAAWKLIKGGEKETHEGQNWTDA